MATRRTTWIGLVLGLALLWAHYPAHAGKRVLDREVGAVGVRAAVEDEAPVQALVRLRPRVEHPAPGALVEVDAWLSGADELRTYQLAFEAVDAYGAPRAIEDLWIDDGRSDFAFADVEMVDAVDPSGARLGALAFDGDVRVEGEWYLGTVLVRAPGEASGTLDLRVRFDGESFLLDEVGNVLAFESKPARIGSERVSVAALVPPGVGDDTCSGGINNGNPCSQHLDCQGGVCGLKSRYITITPSNDGSNPTTIQVTIANMFTCSGGSRDGLGCDDPSDCPSGLCLQAPQVGDVWWAGPQVFVPNAPHPALIGSLLECTATPHSQVWNTGDLHMFGPAIIPGARYEVRMCDASGSTCSGPRTVETGDWGDVVFRFGISGDPLQPDFSDISAVVDKFRSRATAPDMPRADLVGPGTPGSPNTPNQSINFQDISAVVDAFRGFAYPYSVPSC